MEKGPQEVVSSPSSSSLRPENQVVMNEHFLGKEEASSSEENLPTLTAKDKETLKSRHENTLFSSGLSSVPNCKTRPLRSTARVIKIDPPTRSSRRRSPREINVSKMGETQAQAVASKGAEEPISNNIGENEDDITILKVVSRKPTKITKTSPIRRSMNAAKSELKQTEILRLEDGSKAEVSEILVSPSLIRKTHSFQSEAASFLFLKKEGNTGSEVASLSAPIQTRRVTLPNYPTSPSTSGGSLKRRSVSNSHYPDTKKRKEISVETEGDLRFIAPLLEMPENVGDNKTKNEGTRVTSTSQDLNVSRIELEIPDKDILPSTVPVSEEGNDSVPLVSSEPVKIPGRSRDVRPIPKLSKNDLKQLSELGISPALLDVPDAPISIPKKSNYLKAGLMSYHYKCSTDEERAQLESRKQGLEKNVPGGIFPQPVHTGSKCSITQRSSDFTLPYDIWCLGVNHTRNRFNEWKIQEEKIKAQGKAQQLAYRRKIKLAMTQKTKTKIVRVRPAKPVSWKFKKLRSNTYVGLKPTVTLEREVDQLCECPKGDLKCATEDCLNRLVLTECPPACGDNCNNRRIQKHDYAPALKRFLTEKKGYGVRTIAPIKKGDLILEYVGEVVTDSEFKERMRTVYINDTHHYCLQLESGKVIDGHRRGGECRFVNHSCEPNCEMQKWSVNGIPRMALFSLRDINPGEELSYDYNFSLYNPNEGQPCHCGSENCRGVIGERTQNKSNRNMASKRKTGNSKGAYGVGSFFGGRRTCPLAIANMKSLVKRERCYVRSRRLFLLRNYRKMRKVGEKVDVSLNESDRLEKVMSSWILRFKAGSSKNKPIVLPDIDSTLSSSAHTAQILYELYANLVTAKDGTGKFLCGPFMEPPPKKLYPKFYAEANGHKLSGLKAMERRILRGYYKSIQSFETDFRTVLNSLIEIYGTEKPEIKEVIGVITKLYKEGKQKALLTLDPFIIPEKPLEQFQSGSAQGLQVTLPKFLTNVQDDSDVIRCICGTFSPEGMMVLCEKCNVWQHCDCVRYHYDPADAEASMSTSKRLERLKSKVKTTPTKSNLNTQDLKNSQKSQIHRNGIGKFKQEVGQSSGAKMKLTDINVNVFMNSFSGTSSDLPLPILDEPIDIVKAAEIRKGDDYYCEQCQLREIDNEVPMGLTGDNTGRKYYLTLRREDGFLLKKNDTVYVLRDWPPEVKDGPGGKDLPRKTYLTVDKVDPAECDIFRIQDLFRDANGVGFVYGYNYLRPHETVHEASRKFYPNEIMRAPIIETVNIDMVYGVCWVVDAATYCKGRPKGCIEENLYICELGVNKPARVFRKVGKNSQAICTKPYAFDHFETKLQIQRNLHPFGPPTPDFKLKPSISSSQADIDKGRKAEEKVKNRNDPKRALPQLTKNCTVKRNRVNQICEILLKKIDDSETEKEDISYLLAPTVRRRLSRKKDLP